MGTAELQHVLMVEMILQRSSMSCSNDRGLQSQEDLDLSPDSTPG